MKEKVTVIKVGGAIVEQPDNLDEMLKCFCAVPGHKVLVHGGGRSATRIAARLGVESEMVDGRRITDDSMLEVVIMVYGGLVNKQIVAKLQALGVNAVGVTGADMNLIRSHKRPVGKVDYGWVGDIDIANGDAISTLIDNGVMPVVAPLTHDGEGHLLNTNADTIAKEVAYSLTPHYDVTLTFAFEKAGVLRDTNDDRSVIPHITEEQYLLMKEEGSVSGGMIPKLDNAFEAIRKGVSRVVITAATDISGEKGTVLE